VQAGQRGKEDVPMLRPQPGGSTPDLYERLGISRSASRADITRAYHRQARAIHPDSRPQETDASAQFRDLAEAYQILSNPARRADYDRALRPRPPVGRAPAPRPGPAAGARAPSLWAGPVRVDPPASAGGGGRGEDESLAALAELLAVHLRHRPGWPW
jgi:curved DNA-binding protein CbpA